eukprot:CAMPEP_0113719398 /NCGR_PEP_ID=MMETSP0038_2-20120614/35778_1 /TAXON_ID=2898 /ORGANISM="Cryptomonas paramecium" /LENGTH=277 /DNA_ID=CAMNT_0000647737 /DNA_START=157 /DNA_END=990 /DNA_ORIENTATION=+ /assembly_acc=CAM_ASM_000170
MDMRLQEHFMNADSSMSEPSRRLAKSGRKAVEVMTCLAMPGMKKTILVPHHDDNCEGNEEVIEVEYDDSESIPCTPSHQRDIPELCDEDSDSDDELPMLPDENPPSAEKEMIKQMNAVTIQSPTKKMKQYPQLPKGSMSPDAVYISAHRPYKAAVKFDPVTREGWLFKECNSSLLTSSHKRWFTLRKGELCYRRYPTDKSGERKIPLWSTNQISVTAAPNGAFAISVVTPDRTFRLISRDRREAFQWMRDISEAAAFAGSVPQSSAVCRCSCTATCG